MGSAIGTTTSPSARNPSCGGSCVGRTSALNSKTTQNSLRSEAFSSYTGSDLQRNEMQWRQVLTSDTQVTPADNNHEESDNNHEEQRLQGRKRRRLCLSADRCENQGAE